MGVETRSRAAAGIKELDPEAINERTAPGVFYRQATKYADRILLQRWRDEQWQGVSWADLRAGALGAAAALIDAGVKPRDRVIIFSPNCVEWLVADLAIGSVGAVSVPIYPTTIADVARHIAENSEAVLAIVANEETAGRLQQNQQLRQIVRIDGEFQQWMSRTPAAEAMEEIARRLGAVQPDDLGTIIYTSGTTGEPKGVMLAHRNFVDIGKLCVEVLGLREDDVELSFLPYAHSFERLAAMTGMVSGGSGYLSRSKDTLAQDLQDVRPTLFPSVPMIYEKMYRAVHEKAGQQPKSRQLVFKWAVRVADRRLDRERPGPLLALQYRLADRLVLAKIRKQVSGGRARFFVSGGAPLGEHIERFFWALGVKILQGWGLTETAATVTVNTLEQHKYGTVGRPIPGAELKFAEDGEILVKSPGVMLGYFRNEQATSETFQDGWFKTGDIGEQDRDGFLKITDRKKDLIKTAAGKYVAPQGIEAKLKNERYVERVVVVGDERPYVTALIFPNFDELKRDGIGGEPAEIVKNERARSLIQERVNKVNQGLDHFEAIQYFELLDRDLEEEKELTPGLGKPKRRVINENFKDLIEGMYQGKKKPGADGQGGDGAGPSAKQGSGKNE